MKPVLSIMIRVGPNTSFSANLNTFHSQSTQSSGFFTNAGSTEPPAPKRLYANLGWDLSTTPNSQTDVSGQTMIVCNLTGIGEEIEPPYTVSSTYVEVNCVSGGFNAVKTDGYSSEFRKFLSRGDALVFGLPLTIGQNIYFRVDSLTPFPHTYNWYNGASGNSPRDIVAVSADAGTFNPATKTCTALPGQTIDVFYITISSVNCNANTSKLGLTSITGTNSSYSSNWSGSSLGNGGGGFRLIVVNRGVGLN